jgi:serine phosphatase RsbU (regulator of sigma subunit)/anti-sigma regulatory factor (Ser/Thr protein kinase)
MRADESVFPIELTIVPLQVHGQVFFTVSVRDISEKKDNEREKADLLLKYKELATDLERQKMAIAQASQRELEIGTRIQQSLLTASPLRQLSDLWMSSFNQASKGIDGDFVEVIQVGEDCVDIIAGDVMGKGVPAALMGAATKLQFSRALAELLAAQESGQEAPQPIAIVSLVHQAMTPHLQALEAFVTLSYIRIDRTRNVITWVGCGHEESLVIHADGHTRLLPNQHPPLGVLGRVDLIQDQVTLAAGDALFLCSDGLADAVLPNGERIGRESINQTVRKLVREHATPGAVLHCLRRDLLPSDVSINDDVSLVLMMQSPEKGVRVRCELPVDMKSLRLFRDFVRQQAIRAGMAEAEAAIFVVASVEIFTNIIRHAGGLLVGAPVELVARTSGQEFILEVIHLGDAFAPPEELVETNFDVFPEGGFGLMIIRNACDRVDYLHHMGVNTIRMSRYMET